MVFKRVIACPLLFSGVWANLQSRDYSAVCKQIEGAISSGSHVYYPGSLQYSQDISHFATSSTQQSACSVEPNSAEDIAAILKIVGPSQTPFAVKGGGHATNIGFSSTTGVQIAMSKFSNVTYDASSQTVEVGPGLIWDDVYEALEDTGVNVVGGRVSGVGVAGFSLGGGYSWKSNQFGLTIDNIVGYELVLPNGTITNVDQSSNPDLFFGLKGGYNNFGIVTNFVMKAHPQTQVWGGYITYTGLVVDQINNATTKFQDTVTDPKAAIITSYEYVLGGIVPTVIMFYDAPDQPAGIFDDFLAILPLTKDISTRSYLSLVKAPPGTDGSRGAYSSHAVVDYPNAFLEAVVNETNYWGPRTALRSGTLLSYAIEPFLPTLFSHNTTPTAYPFDRSRSVYPFNIYFEWTLSGGDTYMQEAIRSSTNQLASDATAEGQQNIQGAPVYPNYALFDTPLEAMYGDNLPRLRAIKQTIDPDNIMGLAGGFKF